MYQNGELVIFRGWHMASWNYCCPNMACLGIQDRTKTLIKCTRLSCFSFSLALDSRGTPMKFGGLTSWGRLL